MKIAMNLVLSASMKQTALEVAALERAGLDQLWVGESYGFDAVSQIGYLAAATERIEIGTGIINVFSRTAPLVAMTAAGCDFACGGRFNLGLGVSGPQVIRGFHGVPYEKSLVRMQEYIEACRLIWSRKAFEFSGEQVRAPLEESDGAPTTRALKLIDHPLRSDIPIWCASLMDRSVQLTAELANGWLPFLYLPERHGDVWGTSLKAGLDRRDSGLGSLEIAAGGVLDIGEHVVGDERDAVLSEARRSTALYVGGMGTRDSNFYNRTFAAYGYDEEASSIQSLYLDGDRKAAEAVVPMEWLELTNLVGPPGFVSERVSAYKEAGVTSLVVSHSGENVTRQIEQLRSIVDDAS